MKTRMHNLAENKAHCFGLIWLLLLSGCGTEQQPAVEVLLASREQAWTVMKLALGTSEDESIRAAAVEALSQLNEPMARRWLRQALYDPAAVVRFRAVLALGLLPPAPEPVDWSEWLADDEPAVQAAAMLTLIRQGDAAYGQVLWQRIEEGIIPLTDSLAAGWLAEMHRCADLEKLHQLTERVVTQLNVRPDYPAAELTALRCALLRSGDLGAIREMEQRLWVLGARRDLEPEAYQQLCEAVRLLGWSPDPVVRYALEQQWQKQRDPLVRVLAGRSLILLGFPLDGSWLLEWLQSQNRPGAAPASVELWQEACGLLGELGEVRAVPHLQQQLSESEQRLKQMAAAGAILRLTYLQAVSSSIGGPAHPIVE
ncbi:MAG: hypothetical protein HJJLKODD_01240 [Phycisphaerae bacterium]|nr:hypothetical protein [Phycisphaerae bacterium]